MCPKCSKPLDLKNQTHEPGHQADREKEKGNPSPARADADFQDSLSGSSSEDTASPMIVFDRVGLCFQKHASLFELLFKKRKRDFWALKEISFTLHRGETLGVIGRNGSGKSTLSLVCTRVYLPDKGRVRINGRVQLLALGVGFEKRLTGRENVYISGSLLGLDSTEIQKRMPEIEEFADIGEFMDEPVRTYSSGMKSRLGFSIATAIRPDILILDEVMATGDKAFRDKAIERLANLQSLASCALIISHEPGQLKKICHKVLWLDKGRIVMQGDPATVLTAYEKFCKNPLQWQNDHPEFFDAVMGR